MIWGMLLVAAYTVATIAFLDWLLRHEGEP